MTRPLSAIHQHDLGLFAKNGHAQAKAMCGTQDRGPEAQSQGCFGIGLKRRLFLGGNAVLLGEGLQASPSTQAGALHFARFGDWNLDFCFHLLKAALAVESPGTVLLPSRERLSQARAFVEIGRDSPEVDLVWAMSSLEREQVLLPIRFPIFRGLFGWRVLLVRRSEAQRFAHVRHLKDLKAFAFVQGHDWPDADILAANGLKVTRGTQFDSLFAMLAQGRADAFPRSLLEVPSELRLYKKQLLELEPGLVLRYPAPVYCFVSRNRPELAARIERGLFKLLERGESERMLRRFHAEAFALARLPKRRVIDLHNPLLPPETPLADTRLWFKA